MSPTRQKSVNKRLLSDISPKKEPKDLNKIRHRETGKKRAKELGRQWSKGEIKRFYRAYRLYGKNWKKVAAQVRNRSVEMVEALYQMNKAYLSLPEGTATVFGLVAMMTDDFADLENESEEESEDARSILEIPNKYKRPRLELKLSGDLKQSPIAANRPHPDAYLSLLRKDNFAGGQPRAVGRRTPRIPVSQLNMEHENAKKKSRKLETDSKGAEAMDTTQVHRKERMLNAKKAYDHHSDHIRDESTDAEEGQIVSASKRKVHAKVSNGNVDKKSSCGLRRNSKKILSEDKFSALNPLEALAYLSEIESVQLNEERGKYDAGGKYSIQEATSTSHGRHGTEFLELDKDVDRERIEVSDSTSKKFRVGKNLPLCTEHASEEMQQYLKVDKKLFLKRKQKSSGSKVSNEEEKMSAVRGASSAEIISSFKQGNFLRVSEGSGSNDQKIVANDPAELTEQAPVTSKPTFPISIRSRRKADLRKEMMLERHNACFNIAMTNQDGTSYSKFIVQEKLPSLSSELVRRWCKFEWLYSAIDYPWFAKWEFVEYLNHAGLGHITKLACVEWDVIRSSLGNPRRFSVSFLQDERQKLEQYRESVRNHYTELRDGSREGLPADLARPFSVGQRVIAIHPKTRELHDGSVLTVHRDRCRVHFDCPDIGVEFVKDIDCMPLNPLDNMPEILRRDLFPFIMKELPVNGLSDVGGLTSNRHLENTPSLVNASMEQTHLDSTPAIPQVKEPAPLIIPPHIASNLPSSVAQVGVTGVDVQDLSQLIGNVEKKASPVVINFRQNIAYPGDILPHFSKSPANSALTPRVRSPRHRSTVSEESSRVTEIFCHSRLKARAMVDAAVQAMSSIREGEDAHEKTRNAIDSMDKRQLGTEPTHTVIGSHYLANGNMYHHNPSTLSNSDVQPNGTCGPDTEATIPLELITSCVSTLLMIQTCTQQQPPSDVAEIIESAVTSLHPCCPQNLPLYSEIKMSMRRIKTQVLALIPTKI